MYMLSLLISAILFHSTIALANQSSCEAFLKNNFVELSLNPYLLESAIDDDSNIHNLTATELDHFTYNSNEHGQLIYKLSKQVVDTSEDQYHIGVWDFINQMPGEVYGTAESTTEGKQLKHSSFNHNNPVLSAWMFIVKDGFITKIIDGSGRYRPNPISMYLILKKFQSMGLNLNSTFIEFYHGLEQIRGIKIPALNFIEAIENLNNSELNRVQNVKLSTSNLMFFLNLIHNYTDDAFTKSLILIYQLRNKTYIDEELINQIIYVFKTYKMSEIELIQIIRGIFSKNHYNFRGSAVIRKQSENLRKEYYLKLKTFILSELNKKDLQQNNSNQNLDDQILFITTWLNENITY